MSQFPKDSAFGQEDRRREAHEQLTLPIGKIKQLTTEEKVSNLVKRVFSRDTKEVWLNQISDIEHALEEKRYDEVRDLLAELRQSIDV